jgi:hypothetical protein
MTSSRPAQLTFSNMTPVCPLVYVPVAFRSASGNCVKRPLMLPPVLYQEQKAPCMYLSPSATRRTSASVGAVYLFAYSISSARGQLTFRAVGTVRFALPCREASCGCN